MINRQKAQEEINLAAKSASGGGVGFIGVVQKDGSVVLRRDEIYAKSNEIKFASTEDALSFLRGQA